MSNVDFGRYSKRIVQVLWDPEPRNEDGSPIWCLGRRYDTGVTEESCPQQSEHAVVPNASSSAGNFENGATSRSSSFHEVSDVEQREASRALTQDKSWPPSFLDDFEARLWLTYRANFALIPKSEDPRASSAMSLSVRFKSQLNGQGGFTSDTGWGCMIRSGQSMLANAIAFLRLGRDWRRGNNPAEEKNVLSLFSDDPRAPFSIHRFVEHGAAACGTYPGQWFGPSASAKCIEALSRDCHAVGLKVYVTGDGPDVYESTVMRIAKAGSQRFQPTLLLVGTRLGIDRVTPVYWDALKDSLRMPQAVGIAGGRPSASHYFVGTQGDYFFYLDPHHTRPALPYHENAEDLSDEDVESCHTRRLRRLPIEKLDPSMLIAFLFRDEEDWKSWRRRVSEAPGKSIFHVADFEPAQHGHYATERDGAVDEVEAFSDDE